mmetsp:Transcript_20030/g.38632  ORF Transcript_20030/g.38632 Transcript_20030/m.38632 type:complete len:281 (+) Transcript_20030:465-1307(+)
MAEIAFSPSTAIRSPDNADSSSKPLPAAEVLPCGELKNCMSPVFLSGEKAMMPRDGVRMGPRPGVWAVGVCAFAASCRGGFDAAFKLLIGCGALEFAVTGLGPEAGPPFSEEFATSTTRGLGLRSVDRSRLFNFSALLMLKGFPPFSRLARKPPSAGPPWACDLSAPPSADTSVDALVAASAALLSGCPGIFEKDCPLLVLVGVFQPNGESDGTASVPMLMDIKPLALPPLRSPVGVSAKNPEGEGNTAVRIIPPPAPRTSPPVPGVNGGNIEPAIEPAD